MEGNSSHTVLIRLFSPRSDRTAQNPAPKNLALKNSFVFDENNEGGSV
jgi:hypothetical protein